MKVKNFVLLVSMVLMSLATLFAQAPQGFTYQAVVRNSKGQLVSNTPVGVKISILQGSSTGVLVYSDEYRPQTNANGLFSIIIGSGMNSISIVDWTQGPYFLKSEVDPDGGNNYTITTVQQLLSVPYALHAQTAGSVAGGINYDSISNRPINISYFTNDAGYLTSYTESQVLSMNGDTLFLTGGSYVVLPAGFSGNYNDLTNKPTIPNKVSDLTNDAGYLTSYTESQVLSIGHDTLFLTGGSYVVLPAGFSGNYNDLTNKPTIPNKVSDLTNDAGYLTSYTESQTLYNVLLLGNAANSQIKNLTNPTDSMDAVNLRTVISLLENMTHKYDSMMNDMNKTIDSLRQNIDTTSQPNIDTTSSGGLCNAQFSVSATQKVLFSPGNLQWSATNGGNTATSHLIAGNGTAPGTWRFAPNQWDTIGANNGNISSTYTGWIDLFGWGTSGYNNQYPYITSLQYMGNDTNDITNTYYDWGVYNAIYNPKTQTTDAPGTWRTLTKDEWTYLLNTRVTLSGIRYTKANVLGVNGLIIVPDNWNTSVYTLDSTDIASTTYTSNIIGANDWAKMDSAGCVFLPAGGNRYSTSVYSVGSIGGYWSTIYNNNNKAYYLYFLSNSLQNNLTTSTVGGRGDGKSVRLVKNVQ